MAGALQVNFPEGSCGAVIGNKKLELLQFHFHTPSEHALNGRRFAMEAHLVHREVGTDNLTVLGVMIQRSKGAASNPALRKALDLAPEQGGKVGNPGPLHAACSSLHCNHSRSVQRWGVFQVLCRCSDVPQCCCLLCVVSSDLVKSPVCVFSILIHA